MNGTREDWRGYEIFIRESAILGEVMTSSHLALLENRCLAMLNKLRTEGFLTPESHQEAIATLMSIEKKDWPQKSEGCDGFVSKAGKDKFDYSPIITRIVSTLAQENDVTQEMREALIAARLT